MLLPSTITDLVCSVILHSCKLPVRASAYRSSSHVTGAVVVLVWDLPVLKDEGVGWTDVFRVQQFNKAQDHLELRNEQLVKHRLMLALLAFTNKLVQTPLLC